MHHAGEGKRRRCRRRPVTLRNFANWFILALLITLPIWIGALLAMHAPTAFILLSTPLIIGLDAAIVSYHYVDAKQGYEYEGD
jgi:hypothetical protein